MRVFKGKIDWDTYPAEERFELPEDLWSLEKVASPWSDTLRDFLREPPTIEAITRFFDDIGQDGTAASPPSGDSDPHDLASQEHDTSIARIGGQ